MVDECHAKPGVPCKRKLEKGLHVSMKVKDGELYLQLSRYRVYPSPLEWNVVVRDLDGPAIAKPRAEFIDGNYHYLSGRWVLPVALLEVVR
jgi:hypothetical protein